MEEMIEDGLNEKFRKNIWKDIFKEFINEKKILISALIASTCLGVFEVSTGFITKYIIDAFVVDKNVSAFFPFSMLALALTIICVLISFFYMCLAGYLEANVSNNLRIKVFNKYQLLSLTFYDTHAVGHLMARITSDIGKISDVIGWGFVDLLWQVVLFFFTLIAMLLLNIPLTLIALVIAPIIFLVGYSMLKIVLYRNRVTSKLNSQIISTYNENIQGVLTAKTLNMEDTNDMEFKELSHKMREASIKASITMAFAPFIIPSVANLGSFLVNVIGGDLVMKEAITIGTLVAFSTLLFKLMEPISWLADIWIWVISAQASIERVIGVFEEEVEIEDSEEAKKLYGNEELKNKIIRGAIKFENVSFAYKNGEPVLKHFNLEVKPGETIALVGATGAGKSTIVNLFCHFYLPTDGRITMGDLDYKTIPQKWIYDNLGYVLQQPHLFTGSIMENIRYGNKEATDEKIKEVLSLIGANCFIEKLKDGYDTQLGEDGAILSTGQKQLLSLARILVRNPAFFVLDEATSYIDTETEAIVQKAIELTLKGRTSFVVAHRLSTIRNASKIIVIEKGTMLEAGTHDELLAKKGHYYQFYKKQFIENKDVV